MNRTITQDNIHLILPSKVSWITDYLSEKEHLNVVEAVQRIYGSDTYRQMEDEETKMWHLGPVALYEILQEEMSKSTIPDP